ncbi:MAG: transposase [Dehalococcoidia bacterium]|nr:transposase [Dehalococcoidia bacterium]
MAGYLELLTATIRGLFAARADLLLDNLALRHQLAMCRRPPQVRGGDRLLWGAVFRGWTGWRSALIVLHPDTVVRWHREGWRRYWRWKSRSKQAGRPKIAPEARNLIARIARENPRWGAVRIRGELLALGHDVSTASVRRYRRQALRRPPSQRWHTFLANHRHDLWAADFFTVPTLLFQTLYVLVVVSHDRRRIEYFNVTAHPTAAWVWQQVIEATPWGHKPRVLIRDRDRCYGSDFIARTARIGIETVLTPIHTPQANGVVERLIGTLRRECVDLIIPLNEPHLRRVLREYVEYYNDTRPHRTLKLEPPAGARTPQRTGAVVATPILSGLHHRYERKAA